MNQHPFAPYIRTLGRGKSARRDLTEEEAFSAMRMILNDEVEPAQLGAFLMLMRIKEEIPEELAGFVCAARTFMPSFEKPPVVAIDWSAYAGKRRHLPWFTLSALLVAEQGYPSFMHGDIGFQDNRVYLPQALAALGIRPSESLKDAADTIEENKFAFLPLGIFSPKLKEILQLRYYTGLRSPINSMLRMLNPLGATHLMQGIFHPGYQAIHQQAAMLLKQPHCAVIKGEGGEIERNPDVECNVLYVNEDIVSEEHWPAMFQNGRHLKEKELNLEKLGQLWRGEIEDEYGLAAVLGTAAIAFRLLDRAHSPESAFSFACSCWDARDKKKYPLGTS